MAKREGDSGLSLQVGELSARRRAPGTGIGIHFTPPTPGLCRRPTRPVLFDILTHARALPAVRVTMWKTPPVCCARTIGLSVT